MGVAEMLDCVGESFLMFIQLVLKLHRFSEGVEGWLKNYSSLFQAGSTTNQWSSTVTVDS